MKVADMMLTPAIPGTITSRSSRRPAKTAPNSASSSSGRRKLKNAAVGLRQNIRRSSRNWCQASVIMRRRAPARAADGELLEPLPARQRGGGGLVQQRRRVLGDDLHELVPEPVAHPVAGGA